MNETVLHLFIGISIYYAALVTFGIWVDYEKLKLEKAKKVDGEKGRNKKGQFTSLK